MDARDWHIHHDQGADLANGGSPPVPPALRLRAHLSLMAGNTSAALLPCVIRI